MYSYVSCDWEYNFRFHLNLEFRKLVEIWLFLYVKMPQKSISQSMQFSNFPCMGHIPRLPIALPCIVQHNMHKGLLTLDYGWLCSWLNWQQVWPPHYKTSSYAYELYDTVKDIAGLLDTETEFTKLLDDIVMVLVATIWHYDRISRDNG